MVLKRRFGGISAGRVNFYNTDSAAFFHATNDRRLSANFISGCSNDEVGSSGSGHRDKKPV